MSGKFIKRLKVQETFDRMQIFFITKLAEISLTNIFYVKYTSLSINQPFGKLFGFSFQRIK